MTNRLLLASRAHCLRPVTTSSHPGTAIIPALFERSGSEDETVRNDSAISVSNIEIDRPPFNPRSNTQVCANWYARAYTHARTLEARIVTRGTEERKVEGKQVKGRGEIRRGKRYGERCGVRNRRWTTWKPSVQKSKIPGRATRRLVKMLVGVWGGPGNWRLAIKTNGRLFRSFRDPPRLLFPLPLFLSSPSPFSS